MGCCGYDRQESEDLLRIRVNPGPKVNRHCTDPLCCLLFVAVLGATTFLLSILWQVGDIRRIDHGRDHEGNLCGLGDEVKKPFLFYPDLDTDFKKDPTLSGRYGICVASCPQEGEIIEDYGTSRQSSWLVLQPSFPVFQRCVPFQKPTVASSTKLCVKPACDVSSTGSPTKPEQVCGLQRDGTNKFWLLEKLGSRWMVSWLDCFKSTFVKLFEAQQHNVLASLACFNDIISLMLFLYAPMTPMYIFRFTPFTPTYVWLIGPQVVPRISMCV